MWTTWELDVLRRYAHLGPEACSAAVAEQCGTRRSPAACQRQASRQRISMSRRLKCPACGYQSTRRSDFMADGLCRRCNTRYLSEAQRRETELMRSFADGAGRDEWERDLEEANREYAMYRQQAHRLREEMGKEGFAEYRKVSNRLSNRRSDAEKSFEQRPLF